VGLAGYSYAVRSPSLLMESRKSYAKALRLTNEALKSPVDCKKDSTASAIVILGIYEMVTGCNYRSLEAWAEHIRGAAALLKLRGYEQLKTTSGCRILGQVIASLTISCLQFGCYIPDHVVDLYHVAERTQRIDDPAWKVQGIMIETTNIHARLRDGSLSDPQLSLDILLELDGRISTFLEEIPPGWEYETVIAEFPTDYIYNGKYQVYCDYWIAHMFNMLRTARIVVNEHVRRILLKGFARSPPLFTGAEFTEQFQKSSDVLYQVSDDIFSTVPQHLGHVVTQSLYHTRFAQTNQVMSPVSRAAGGYFLLWPLCAAASSDVSTDEMRAFGVKVLDYIGKSMGIQLAFALMKLISVNPC